MQSDREVIEGFTRYLQWERGRSVHTVRAYRGDLAALAERTQRHGRYAEALVVAVRDDVAREAQVTLLVEAARVRAEVDRHHRIAQSAFRRQDLTTAIREWSAVLDLDPSNDLARARRQEAIDLQERLKRIR